MFARKHKFALTVPDVLEMLGRPVTRSTKTMLRREVNARIRAAKGKLDRYAPKLGTKKEYRFTKISVRYIFSEYFDRKDEIERRLVAQFRDIERRLDELEARIMDEAEQSRGRDKFLADKIREVRDGRGRPAA